MQNLQLNHIYTEHITPNVTKITHWGPKLVEIQKFIFADEQKNHKIFVTLFCARYVTFL